jgi:hypothetical protein
MTISMQPSQGRKAWILVPLCHRRGDRPWRTDGESPDSWLYRALGAAELTRVEYGDEGQGTDGHTLVYFFAQCYFIEGSTLTGYQGLTSSTQKPCAPGSETETDARRMRKS